MVSIHNLITRFGIFSKRFYTGQERIEYMPKSIFSPEYNKLRQLLIAARQAKNLTQNQVAIRLGKPQSFISKYERGERRLDIIEFLHVTDALEISPLAMVMQLQPELARDDRPKDILEEWAMTSQDLTTLLNQNPSLRGMLFGYTAEFKLEEIWLKESEITFCYKDDDHDRTKKGDRRIIYKDQTFIIEAKSVQTNSIKYDAGRWVGKTQVDASDRRKIVLPNGDTVNTTLLQVGEFDVLAVNVY